ncbi:MAG: ABC transporter permease, partial [Candidatus Binatia bacterium]
MGTYVVRRILWTIPILAGVVMITFSLFSLLATDPARQYAGKFATPEVLEAVRARMGLDKPRWLDVEALAEGRIAEGFDSQFFDIVFFQFPESMRWEAPLSELIRRKAPASMMVQVPAFLITLGLQLSLALYVAFHRGRAVDTLVTFLAVLGMSVPALSIYILAQWLFGQELEWFPVAGWENGVHAVRFAALPILLSVVIGLGGGVRFYRTVMLEEVNADYVRTARAKGVGSREIMFTHVLRNAMIPVITNTVTALPGLVLGALLLERIFQIPGLGNLMVEAIGNNDRSVVMGMTYVLSIVYCGLLL